MTWSRTRKLIQGLTFAAFVLVTAGSVGLGWSWLPGDILSRLDPLVGLAAIVASRTWIAFWAAALGTIVLTAVFGRAWCGWICPLGTLLDIAPARRRKPAKRISRRLGAGKYVTFAVVMGAAVLGSLSPMILDPVTILTRPLQELARPFVGADAVAQAVGASLSRVSMQPIAFLSLIPLAIVLALNAVQRRVWCRDLCPLGGLLAVVSHLPGVRRVVDPEACTSCGRCAAVCPTDAIDRSAGHQSSAAECTDCMLCTEACPTGANAFAKPRTLSLLPAFRPDRRVALIATGAAGLSLGVVMLPTSEGQADILRPPSTSEQRLAELCVRCGACYSTCPTGVLRPSLSLVSQAGPWTPMLDERPTHCTLNCNRCAQSCPTDAIHTPDGLEAALLGLGAVATVNRTQCRAWARNRSCMACQAQCPISGALLSQERPPDPRFPGGRAIRVPVVDESLCVGCNQCMTACPMMPPAIGVDLPPFIGNGSTMPRMPRARLRGRSSAPTQPPSSGKSDGRKGAGN